MKLHLIGFPHTVMGDPKFTTCAYTSKVAKFARMGWEDLLVYASEGSEVPEGVTLVECITSKERVKIFGKPDPKLPPEWPTDTQWERFNSKASIELAKRSENGDLLLLAGGASQGVLAYHNQHLIACEPGVGYEGIYTPFCAFESYAWQHFIYGKYGLDGRWFDRVIPNYFDLDEFPVVNNGGGDHLLFVGRVVQRKGLQAAADIAKACKMPLKVAGPGPTQWRKGKFITAPEITIKGNIEYLGVLGPKERNEAMAQAAVLLAPTVYVEPFGGVAVEAQLSGTPVVATDWGAFSETVHRQTGARFRTLNEAVEAVEWCKKLNNMDVRKYAELGYGLMRVKRMFEEWFAALDSLRRDGWYELR